MSKFWIAVVVLMALLAVVGSVLWRLDWDNKPTGEKGPWPDNGDDDTPTSGWG